MVGLPCWNGAGTVGDLTVKSWSSATSSFSVTGEETGTESVPWWLIVTSARRTAF